MKKYLIPAILAFLFAVLLWQIQKDRIELTYSINDSELFPIDSTVAKFFVIDLENTGNKEIENIEVDIKFKDCQILNISNSQLKNSKLTHDIMSVQGNLPLLNPKEGIKIKCTTIGEHGELKHFSARAKGVTASSDTTISFNEFILPLITIVFIIVLAFYYLYYRQNKIDYAIEVLDVDNIEEERLSLSNTVNEKLKQSETDRKLWLEKLEKENEERERGHKEYLKKLKEEGKEREKKHKEEMQKLDKQRIEIEQGKPDRDQLIFNCLNQNGLTYLFFKILNLGDGMTYLNTGFTLFAEFLNNTEDSDKILKAVQSLSEFEMAPTSKGMIFYLAGKMESIRNNHERVNYWLNKCKDEYPILYKFLMENDDNFDLKQLEEKLKNNWP